ncbi:MBL fold metallo-hydrolase [Streptomyces sp. NPDC001544]|uniref:MBL fold metallo-hydrolase n=1 Tax=Streptomyces sp. NPDC001544 TaxID=3364584 RepID=UPI00369BE0AE
MQTFTLGAFEITRVTEWHGRFAPVGVLFPSIPDDAWHEHQQWLNPHFWDAASGDYQAHMQTWVLRGQGRTILVDTGMGNGKPRAHGLMDNRDGDFLHQLAAIGVQPEDVDTVVNTHLHIDHVGWNTRLDNGEWVPTFPNAQYLMHKADFDYWNPANNITRKADFGDPADSRAAFNDSVLPVHQAGQALIWKGTDHTIAAGLSLQLAPGHTPGSTVLKLHSGTDRAFFVGDLVHTPLQFLTPAHDTCLSEDQQQATVSRRRMMEEAADTNALIIPAHLGGAGAAEVARNGRDFTIKQWAPLAAPTAKN